MTTIFYDNDSIHLAYIAQESVESSGMYIGGSLTGASGLTVIFQGTSITLSGYIKDDIIVIIDGENQPALPAAGHNEILGVFYQSPILPDATHNLTMTSPGSDFGVSIINVDYATVTAGENTPLRGERLIVDEIDPSVVLDGGWIKNNTVLNGPEGSRNAYANTTHQTSSPGASATIHFNGTTVSVFGVCSVTGLVNLEIELDGTAEIISPSNFRCSQNTSTNFQWYQKDSLPSTKHTLKMTNTDGDAPFNLDYIIYTPSIASIRNTTTRNSTTSPPNHAGISRATLMGAVIGPVVSGVIIISILLALRKKKLFLWSYRQRHNTVNPFQLPHLQSQGLSQLRVYHKSDLVNGQNVAESPIPDEDLPLVEIRHVGLWPRLWRRPDHGTVEAFPHNWDPLSPHQPMVRQKPTLPTWHVARQRASRSSDAGSGNETIVADPRVQELEDMVVALQQEIEETRQDRSGAQNGALMRELVASRGETLNEGGQQEHGDHGSVAVSTTVV